MGSDVYGDNYAKKKLENTFRTGSRGTPSALRNGRMPFRRAVLQDGESTVAVFSAEHKINADNFRKRIRKMGITPIRQVTSEKVYLKKDLETLLPKKKQDKKGE